MPYTGRNKHPLTCFCCGKRIRRGSVVYRVPGLYYRCCSAECLLSAVAPNAVAEVYNGNE